MKGSEEVNIAGKRINEFMAKAVEKDDAGRKKRKTGEKIEETKEEPRGSGMTEAERSKTLEETKAKEAEEAWQEEKRRANEAEEACQDAGWHSA